MGSSVRGRGRIARLQTLLNVLRSTYGVGRWWPGRQPFEIALGAVLVQHSTWTGAERALRGLRRALTGRRLSVRRVAALRPSRLARLIRPAGLARVKAARIHRLVHWWRGRTRGFHRTSTLHLRHELLRINGVGPETADAIVAYAFHRPVFVVDTYTRRILRRHGLAERRTSYDTLQRQVTSHLPPIRGIHQAAHGWFVEVGKRYCRREPRCERCPARVIPRIRTYREISI